MNALSVIAGGWSAGLADFDKVPGTKIGINDSAFWARCPICVSMDRLWMWHRLERLAQNKVETWLRRSAFRKGGLDESGKPWLHLYECDHKSSTMSENGGALNGTNSAAVGLNLAFQLALTMENPEIYLFGFDGRFGPNNEARWYDHYPWNERTKVSALGTWAGQYRAAAAQFTAKGIKVFIVGDWSVVDAFPRVSFQDLGCAK